MMAIGNYLPWWLCPRCLTRELLLRWPYSGHNGYLSRARAALLSWATRVAA